MSDNDDVRSERDADRPDEVTDPLLWRRALEVADAHEPDGEGGCRNLLCAGQPWPCPAWNSAQHALRVARGGRAPATRFTQAGGPDLPSVPAPRSQRVTQAA
ncbi:hypothetical protein [Micromonospora sp. NPDC126480]|uniref:hypothetical protein n=1 Tax=Micromonospora sp. NPDC126480 TaxID=3155312 RepID=UPI00331D61BB